MLYCACWNNNQEIVQILLQHKTINVNLQNTIENTPFLCACFRGGYENVMTMVQDARVNINLDDDCGCSPLIWACLYGHTKIVKLLLSYGRKIDVHHKTTYYYLNLNMSSTALTPPKKKIKQKLYTLSTNISMIQKKLRKC